MYDYIANQRNSTRWRLFGQLSPKGIPKNGDVANRIPYGQRRAAKITKSDDVVKPLTVDNGTQRAAEKEVCGRTTFSHGPWTVQRNRGGEVMSEFESDGGTLEEASQIDRRDLLKKGVLGVGVAGVVWAAPHIDRLSLRPDYASAASVTKACSGDFTFDAALPGTKNGPAKGSGSQKAKACTDLTLSINQDYGPQVDRPDRFWKTVKVDKSAGGTNCTITKLTFDPSDVTNGPCVSNAPTPTGTADQCSDFGANNGVYGSYLVHDSACVGCKTGLYHSDTGYTLTANGAFAHFSSDPDQSSDLGPPSGGGNVKIKVHCT